MADTQISAYISEATKQEVERYANAHGVKKGHLVEEALLHHLQALRELPADAGRPRRPAAPHRDRRVVRRGDEAREEPAQADEGHA
jgi:hypothetical protein